MTRTLVMAATLVVAATLTSTLLPTTAAAGTLDFERLAALRWASNVVVSPHGTHVAYILDVPRRPGHDDDGKSRRHLRVVDVATGADRAFVHGDVRLSTARFTPDGAHVTYLGKRQGDKHDALWVIPVAGGESYRAVSHKTTIEDYRVSPDGQRVLLIAQEPVPDDIEKARKKGYKQRVFEEDWQPRRLWVSPFVTAPPGPEDPNADRKEDDSPKALALDGSAFEAVWLPDGRRAVVTLAPTPLIDDRYMARKLHVVDVDSGTIAARIENPGKLGEFRVSPDGAHVAMISAADANDTREGRLMVAPITGGPPRDLMGDYHAHVNDIAWLNADSIMYTADHGVETELGEVDLAGRKRRTHARSGNGVPVMTSLSLSSDGKVAAFRGESPKHPPEVYVIRDGDTSPRRLTDNNPWLAGVSLASQEAIRWKARDGLELEGLLVRPLDGGKTPAPLLLMVHGGPESQDRNGWLTSYARPAQLAAAAGYAVLFPNYRGSTGRGVAFAKTSQGDAAGKEFDDLVDAVDHLIKIGVADAKRVGINGGSYGGYATAWCSTFYSERFKAGVMFVGISNKLSKGLTTEIPVEDVMVHTRYDPWTKWEFSLERSPIFHAHKSRTALLIATGDEDTRVHPSQSLQLYRALKGIGQTPVRFVRYPDEGHGNRRAAAQNDYARRLMRWMNWHVRDLREGTPPWALEHDLGEDEDKDKDKDKD